MRHHIAGGGSDSLNGIYIFINLQVHLQVLDAPWKLHLHYNKHARRLNIWCSYFEQYDIFKQNRTIYIYASVMTNLHKSLKNLCSKTEEKHICQNSSRN